MSHGRFDDPVSATLAGIKDIFAPQELRDHLTDADRLDGKTCLVTGANRGLGLAIAVELARRGGRVIMACRSDVPRAGARVTRASGSPAVEMVPVDLSDVTSIHAMCDELQRRGHRLDVTVLNAGVTPPRSRRTPQGQDLMFAVNYMANFILINRLLSGGVIPRPDPDPPRIIFISSDSHQGASAIHWDELGRYTPYGVRGAINNYSYFKLLLNTLATELSRRLGADADVNVICPGPVNTDIIRDAPLALRLVLRAIFTVFFQSPARAALPVAYLAASPEVTAQTNLYLHMFHKKRMDAKVYDEAAGARLWRASQEIWHRVDPLAGQHELVNALDKQVSFAGEALTHVDDVAPLLKGRGYDVKPLVAGGLQMGP